MDWVTIRSAIKAAIVTTSQLREQDVFWAGTPPATGWHGPSSIGWGALPSLPPCTVELKIRQVQAKGQNEYRNAYVSTPSPARTSAIVGSRKLLVQIKIESEQQTDGFDCQAVASKIRVRLKRKSVIEALQVAKLGQGELGPAINADYVDQGRVKSVCIMELPLWAAEVDLDDTAGSADWITSTRLESDPGSDVVLDTGQVPNL